MRKVTADVPRLMATHSTLPIWSVVLAVLSTAVPIVAAAVVLATRRCRTTSVAAPALVTGNLMSVIRLKLEVPAPKVALTPSATPVVVAAVVKANLAFTRSACPAGMDMLHANVQLMFASKLAAVLAVAELYSTEDRRAKVDPPLPAGPWIP